MPDELATIVEELIEIVHLSCLDDDDYEASRQLTKLADRLRALDVPDSSEGE